MNKIPYVEYKVKENNVDLSKEAHKYFKIAARESGLIRDVAFLTWLINYITKTLISINNEYYADEKVVMANFADLMGYIVKNWKKLAPEYQKRRKHLIKSSEEVSKSIKTKNNKLISKKFREFFESNYDYGIWVWGPWGSTFILEKELLEKFPEHIELISSVDEPIEYEKMRRDLFKLTPKQLVKKYGWINTYTIYHSPFTEDDFKKMKLEVNRKELEEQFKKYKTIKVKFKNLLKSIKDEELRTKTEILHVYAFLRTDRVDAIKIAMQNLKPFCNYLTRLAKGLTLKDAANLSTQEVSALLEQGKIPDIEKVRLRSEGKVVYYYHDNRIDIITDEKRVKEVTDILHHSGEETKEFKGFSACKGKVTGTVKVISSIADLKKIKEGDVFVSNFTTPTYTPYMIKCKAVVTNEGGLTSHAAIIAREYNIPCIIGTKVATTVLKDGDLVEVNADAGVVRKIR